MVTRPRPKLTYDDYANLPDDGRRRQLIAGEVSVVPSPNTRHQQIAGTLYRLLGNHLEARGGGRVFIAPYDVVLTESDVVQPGVVFVADDRIEIITDANIRGAPSLAVEVVSDPVLDKRVKRDLYARARVPEYWVVDPEADRIEVHLLAPGGYGEPTILEPGDRLSTPMIPGLEIDVAALLRR